MKWLRHRARGWLLTLRLVNADLRCNEPEAQALRQEIERREFRWALERKLQSGPKLPEA